MCSRINYAPEEDDVAEHIALVPLDLFRPCRGPLGQVLVDQLPANQVTQEVTERRPGGGAEANLKPRKGVSRIGLIRLNFCLSFGPKIVQRCQIEKDKWTFDLY